MGKSDRIRACYQHAVLRYISGDFMTNASLRERFGIAEKNYSMVSRVISAAINENRIRPADPSAGARRHAKYVPYWA
jgi:ATP-dependent DNA helicase RecG